MVGIVTREMKWYSRNNRRQWCFKEANVEAVEVFTSSGLLSRLGGTDRLHLVSQAGRGHRSNRPSVKIALHLIHHVIRNGRKEGLKLCRLPVIPLLCGVPIQSLADIEHHHVRCGADHAGVLETLRVAGLREHLHALHKEHEAQTACHLGPPFRSRTRFTGGPLSAQVARGAFIHFRQQQAVRRAGSELLWGCARH